MTDLMEARMFDPTEGQNTGRRHVIWLVLASTGIVMMAGFVAGFVSQHQDHGSGTFTAIATAILAAAILAITGLGYWSWRSAVSLKVHGADLNRRERLNRYVLSVCIFVGGIMGFSLAFYDLSDGRMPLTHGSMLSNSPLPLTIALFMAFLWAVVMPTIAYYWHRRAIDEQEANAYRDGSLAAGYAYLIGAPTWWMLWRGGVVPEPDGIVIFVAFSFIWSAVWFWKKYR